MTDKPITFAVVGADHAHIHSMAGGMLAVGALCKGWWTEIEPAPAKVPGAPFGGAPRVDDPRRLLDDPEVDLILIAAKPTDRTRLSIDAMRQGKDVIVDKPACLTLDEVAAVRGTVKETGRIWSVSFSERYWIRAMVKAGELVKQGAVGEVVQTVGLGPHRGFLNTRADWFFEPESSGGIIGDMAAHQIDHFMFFTGSTEAEIISAAKANFGSPKYPRFEDWGEVLLQGDKGRGYIRVDWLTPDAQPHAGDNKLVILGLEGQIEVRKFADPGGRPGGDHLVLLQGGKVEYMDCSQEPVIYFRDLVHDIRNRTELSAPQEHSFVCTELAIKAQAMATPLGALAR